MRFRGLFKVPQHRNFDFEPRYYDPVKEEIAKKERFAKAEMEAEKRRASEGRNRDSQRISDAFQSRRREQNKPLTRQVLIAVILTGLMAWLYFYVLGLSEK